MGLALDFWVGGRYNTYMTNANNKGETMSNMMEDARTIIREFAEMELNMYNVEEDILNYAKGEFETALWTALEEYIAANGEWDGYSAE